jgi:hypothetical protein
MQFPYEPKTVDHAHGGKIVKVYGTAHKIDKPSGGYSRDYWFFDCDVLWNDSGKVCRHEVEPFKLCAEDGGKNPEIRALSEAMDAHLRTHGEWREAKPQGWCAHRKVKAAA